MTSAECREALAKTLARAIDSLVALYPFTQEEMESEPCAPTWPMRTTAAEEVAAVLPQNAACMAHHLTWARTVLDALCSAWEARMQETAASA